MKFVVGVLFLLAAITANAENEIDFMVLDRPNPNGHFVDGPVLKPGFESFIGLHQIPVVHGMTVGEYARMVNEEGWLKNQVKVEAESLEKSINEVVSTPV